MTRTLLDRSAIMRAVKSSGTKPEMVVRRAAWRIRPGYRLHRKDIPGRPDIAYVGARKAIFVHGCFWHGHDCKRGARVPKQNGDYWTAKIARNCARDAKAIEALHTSGWSTLVIWECELSDDLGSRLRWFLG